MSRTLPGVARSPAASATRPERPRQVTASALLLVLVGVATALWRFDGSLGILNDDAARYMVLGHALATGQGYRHLNEPEAPPDRKYPPGYPAMIAAVTSISGPHRTLDSAVAPVKMLNVLFLAGVVTLTAAMAARTAPGNAAVLLGATAVVGMHPLLHRFTGAVMSEVPYLFMSLIAIVVIQWIMVRAVTERRAWRWGELLAVALLLGVTMMIRTVGVTLVASTAGLLLWRGRRREAFWVVAIPAMLIATWAVTQSAMPGSSRHIPYTLQWLIKDPASPELGSLDLDTLVRRPITSVQAYGAFLAEAATPGLESVLPRGARIVASVLLTGVGFVMAARRRLDLAELYVAAYAGFIIMWPWIASRFIVPLLPFVALYFLKGLHDAVASGGRLLGSRWSRFAPATAVALLTVTSVIATFPAHQAAADDARRPLDERVLGGGWDGYWRAVRWIHDHPDATSIVTRNPAFMHVYTGRMTTTYPNAEPEGVTTFLLQSGATHVVEDGYTFLNRTEKYLRPALERLQATNRVRLVAEAGDPPTRIWALTQE